MLKVLLLLVLLLVLLGAPRGLWGQAGAAGVLAEMATHAGVIFSGEVVSVARHDQQGFVEIRFQVDAAVRGCVAGGPYTVREWAGRWVGHSERYRVGQRLLMLLTPPGPAGLSAPVYGTDGAIPVVAGATGTLGDVGVAAQTIVDLRLLAARVAATPVVPTPVQAGAVHNNLIVVGPIAMDGTAAVWPALADVLLLLRGGSFAGA